MRVDEPRYMGDGEIVESLGGTTDGRQCFVVRENNGYRGWVKVAVPKDSGLKLGTKVGIMEQYIVGDDGVERSKYSVVPLCHQSR